MAPIYYNWIAKNGTDLQSYSNIVTILNRLISHLNKNRIGGGTSEVALIPEPCFEDLVQMKAAGKELKDYMDQTSL